MPSYGTVIFSQDGRVLLRRPSNDFGGYVWTHAKGQSDPGEAPEEAAVRETFEETGYRVTLGPEIGTFRNNGYDTTYWVAYPTGPISNPGWETSQVRWFSPEEAFEKLKLSEKMYKNVGGTRRDIAVLEAAMRKRSRGLGQISADEFMIEGPVSHGGSNPGGVYTDSSGKRRYIKFSQTDPQQLALENFTNKLYNDLGVPAINTYLILGENPLTGRRELGLASDFLGLKPFPRRPSEDLVDQYVRGVVVDMFTVNWDAGPHNLAVTQDGTLLRMDQGGALLFRAQGAPKNPRHLMPPSETRTFFESFSLPSQILYPAGYKQYEDLSDVANDKIDEILALRAKYGGWAGYVQEKGEYIHPVYASQLVKLLEDRTAWFDQNRP
jgi:8-oxo-dGTP pyrophosphatase MutT (NUDIX family)